jgi:hypothetical protein
MTEAQDGRQVGGMDLHRRCSVLVRMTKDGQRLGTAGTTNRPAAPRAEIAETGTNPRVVLEATYGSAGQRTRLRNPAPSPAWRARWR